MTDEAFRQSTTTLLSMIKNGKSQHRDELYRRCLPMMLHFAKGRLPISCRSAADTEDLVQVTLMKTLNKLDKFESQKKGGFFAYLRTIMLNAVRDEIRKQSNKIRTTDADKLPLAAEDSVVAKVIGLQTLAAYEDALPSLSDKIREAVILRIEFDLSYEEIAMELDISSSDTARMRVARGLTQLAELMP